VQPPLTATATSAMMAPSASLTSTPAPVSSHALRPPMLAASFLLPRRNATAAAAAANGPAASPSPRSLRLDAGGQRISSHYQPHEWSNPPLQALLLTQPLLLPPPPPPAPAHLRGSAPASALSGGSSSSTDPRDVQLEVGCSMELLRALCIVSGSWVEVESATAAAASASPSAPAPPRALARLRLVRLDDQLFEGKRRVMAALGAAAPTDTTGTALQPFPAASAIAAAAGVSSASVLLLPPSLHFHLFASASPLPSAAMADDAAAPLSPLIVRIRKFLPPVPTANPQLQNMVHTLRNGQ